MTPLRVYLDLNKWIDLARANLGRPDADRYQDVLAIARHGKQAGLAAFPLSSTHFMELLRVRSAKQRHEVGSVMAELSALETMVSGADVLPGEVDRALRARWGRPPGLREVAIFGHGAGHAFNEESFVYHLPDHVEVDEVTRQRIETAMGRQMEEGLLMGPLQDFPYGGVDPRDGDEQQDKHAGEERELGALIRKSGRQGGDFRQIWEARTLAEIVPAIAEAMLRAGLSPTLFAALGADGVKAFLADLPTSSALFELRYRRHRDPALPWTRRDLHDLHALSMAVVHCDVVVTERHMAGLIHEAKLDVRHRTTVLTDLTDLGPALVAPAA
jgi:hypothetical protein